MRHLTLISTGGTIEKTYDEAAGALTNTHSIVQEMLSLLRLEDTVVNSLQLMQKDSQDMTDADRDRMAEAVRLVAGTDESPTDCEGIIILHGTDTLCETGDHLHAAFGDKFRVPIVLVGAMRPFEMKRSDALQNLTEAIFAAGYLSNGVYVVGHGRALKFPGPVKDRARGTFVMGGAAS